MTTRTFATWVEPIAAALADGRREVVAFARSLPANQWDEPSALSGWTRKDVLAHLAGETGKVSVALMRAAAGVEPLDVAAYAGPDGTALSDGGDALNARDVADRSATPVDELIAEIEADGEEWQELLSRFDEDTDCRWEGFPVSLRQYLDLMLSHDRDHLAEMRAGLEPAS